MPKDYYTGKPRGFAFVQYIDPYDASEAHYYINGQIFAGREISVVFSVETRKRPEEMRQKARVSSYRGPADSGCQKPSYHGRSRSRSVSRSRFSHNLSRYNSRSFSPGPRWRSDHSLSPRRQAKHPRSPREGFKICQCLHSNNTTVACDHFSELIINIEPGLFFLKDCEVTSLFPLEGKQSILHHQGLFLLPQGSNMTTLIPLEGKEGTLDHRGPPGELDGDQKQSSYSPGYGYGMAKGNIYTSLKLHKASGGNCHAEHQDHPLDLDQGLLICHPGIKDEMVGPMLCRPQNNFFYISGTYVNTCDLLKLKTSLGLIVNFRLTTDVAASRGCELNIIV